MNQEVRPRPPLDLPFILLAAGRSERMGRPKGLLEHHGQPWLLTQIEAIQAQTDGVIRVVLGPRQAGEAALLQPCSGVQVVVNPHPERGPFTSLQAGLRGIIGPVFAGPLDCPVTSVLHLLAASLAGGVACQPTHQGRGGHPVLLGAAVIARIMALDARLEMARLDRVLGEAQARRVEVGDGRILLNLNTPSEWQAYLDGFGERA